MLAIAVPQLADNFAYLVIDDIIKESAVVDCAEAGKVLTLRSARALVTTALSTHWHFDAAGGNKRFAGRAAASENLWCAGPKTAAFPAWTRSH